MFSGARAYQKQLRPIWNESDAVMITYYPIKSDFTVEPPAVVKDDFRKMAELAPDKPVFLLEAGYPSSKTCKSTESMQAEFVHQVFQAWDAHSKAIRLISFSVLTDLSPEMMQKYQRYYGVRGAAFGEFLRTLGICTWPGKGSVKPAYRTFMAETSARGWNAR
jgi:hypothetical protein